MHGSDNSKTQPVSRFRTRRTTGPAMKTLKLPIPLRRLRFARQPAKPPSCFERAPRTAQGPTSDKCIPWHLRNILLLSPMLATWYQSNFQNEEIEMARAFREQEMNNCYPCAAPQSQAQDRVRAPRPSLSTAAGTPHPRRAPARSSLGVRRPGTRAAEWWSVGQSSRK